MVETDTQNSETEIETETETPAEGKGKSAGKAKRLVIVESPAKAKTIKKYLGAGYTVKASVGHVKDLPTKTIGVDVDNGFTPSYEVIKGKKKVIDEIRASAKEVQEVFLAPDPDREGEAIAWHIAEEIRPINPNLQRILFNEITKKGVAEGLAHPRPLDQAKFESQQARRILDRLVGYEISPLLWKKVRRGLSAGRVQSVAVRLVVEREELIEAFKPREYWNIVCTERTADGVEFEAKLAQVDGKKPVIGSGDDSASIVAELERMPHRVASLELRQRPRKPLPPFITSKLQQEAARAFRFPAKRTMGLAQRLYEGIDLGGDEGVVGLITYMRTDSTRISDDAVTEVRTLIKDRYGEAYLPEAPLVYAAAKRAQDAHEAIRPTSVALEPESLRERILAEFKPTAKTTHGLTRHEAEDLMRLYGLIWRRFVACQMNPAIYDQTIIDIAAGDAERLLLRAQGQAIAFPGYQAVYEEAREDGSGSGNGNGNGKETEEVDPAVEEKKVLPTTLPAGAPLALVSVVPEQKFTQPPPRFSEALLVKELEEQGIGRPSTYAAIISTIQDRKYVDKEEGRFKPSILGRTVNRMLVAAFPDILNVEFTARMEDRLDRIDDGGENWVTMLREFYTGFHEQVERAKTEMQRPDKVTDIVCEVCGVQKMIVRWGRNGPFLACQGYPECRSTKEIRFLDEERFEVVVPKETTEVCELCGAPMVYKSGRFGEFLACSKYPECKSTKPVSLGLSCPKEGCGGQIVQKRSRKGKVFYGCGNYAKTQCDYVTWDRPVAGPCPACGHPLLVRKVSRAGAQLKCPACSHAPSEEEVAAAASGAVTPNVVPAPAAPLEPNVAPPATPAEA